MAKLSKAMIAAAVLSVMSGAASAGILDGPSAGETPKDNRSSGVVRRTLEITQATGRSAMQGLASPAKFARWISEARGHQLAIGVTINR